MYLEATPTEHSAAAAAASSQQGHAAGALDALAALDTHLLARHSILLEDLDASVLRQWVGEPDLLESGGKLEGVRTRLYGESRFPIPVQPQEELPVTGRRRQLVIERETQSAAVREYMAMQEAMAQGGRAASSGSKQRFWKPWVEDLSRVIAEMREGRLPLKGKGVTGLRMVYKLDMEPELLAVIACQTVLNLLLVPSYKRSDRAAQSHMIGSAPYTSVVLAIGEAVSLETCWRDAGHGYGPSRSAMALLRKSYSVNVLETQRQLVPVGASLVSILVEKACIEVDRRSLTEEELAEWAMDAPNQKRKKLGPVRVKAFHHELRYEGTKTRGYLRFSAVAQRQVHLMEDTLMNFLSPKHLPMVVPPRPWRPAGALPQGGYLMHLVPFIRTTNQRMTCLRSYSPGQVARVMDFLGSTTWRINRWILEVMTEAQSRDLAIAEIPPKDDPEVPKLPEDHASMDQAELAGLKLRIGNAKKRCQELISARPTFALKLRVARNFEHSGQLYFPHNVDFRGRAYPIPPHLNHIGDDVCRGLLMFAEGKPLGEEGLFWMKVCLANLYGKNKISLAERAAFVDESREWILRVADEPLAKENLEYWVNADDGPWQALARIKEIAEAWRSGEPSSFRSHLPIQLDGSCNGLQHYAAIGRDEEGAKAVNLLPSDRPQDVYSVVLDVVKVKVSNDAAEGPSEEPDSKPYLARRLIDLNVLQRKVVKQTIMTICYGVTMVGAREQVLGQLQERLGDQLQPAELRKMASYLAKLVLQSIDEIFDRAMKIKKWFDKVSGLLNGAEAPTCWISPIGLACAQPYKEARKVQVLTKLQSVTLADQDGHKVHKMKQRMGFPPNFIHSLDATHMMTVAQGCQREGICFAGVHDSFWTHACDAPVLNRVIREAFFEVHSRPILQEFRRDLLIHTGGLLEIPPLPEQGSLDLSQVLKSTYIFN